MGMIPPIWRQSHAVAALLKLCGFPCLVPLFFFGYGLLPFRPKRLFSHCLT
jgi:hypothetical protein